MGSLGLKRAVSCSFVTCKMVSVRFSKGKLCSSSVVLPKSLMHESPPSCSHAFCALHLVLATHDAGLIAPAPSYLLLPLQLTLLPPVPFMPSPREP